MGLIYIALFLLAFISALAVMSLALYIRHMADKPKEKPQDNPKPVLTDEQIKARERAQAQYKRDIDALMTYTGDKQE